MVSLNPFSEFRKQCESVIQEGLNRLDLKVKFESHLLDVPPDIRFGELSFATFEVAKKINVKPYDLAKKLRKLIQPDDYPLIRYIEVAGEGYVNFHVDFPSLSKITIESVLDLKSEYGFIKTDNPKEIIIEHTSANPISPINIGKARNPFLGDALVRLLKARGNKVSRHFYIDDVGRQTAVVAFGYNKLGELAQTLSLEKPDHMIGLIYTITSCIVEIQRLKHALSPKKGETDTRQKLLKQLDEWTSIAAELEEKHQELFNYILDSLKKEENIEYKINKLNRDYEKGLGEAKRLVREVCQLSLKGIKETLSKVGIYFDSWDWESELAWSGEVSKILEVLKKTGYVFQEGPVLEFDADRVAEDLELKEKLGIKSYYEIPSLTLVRADGTTLYTTRDIPYTLKKFRKAKVVINVVGMDQTLPQQQLRLALWALGHVYEAENLTHFAHNLVTLPGYKMSSRRGRYISLDQVIDEALDRAYTEVEKKSPHLSKEEKHEIAKIVGIGALKYALIEVDPIKEVVFTWDRVINFETNSAPYIQYSYARARSILRKAVKEKGELNHSTLTNSIEHDLILTLARFPEIFVSSADNLKPNSIADFVNALADKFNSFYNSVPVLKAESKELRIIRLALVEACSIVTKNSLELIGIVAPERM